MSGRRSLLRDKGGAAAVEFAFVAPVAILLMIGVIESGRLMFVVNSMEGALSTAAREWMTNPEASDSHVVAVFCERAILVDCSETDVVVTTETVDGQVWRVMTARAPFQSPLSGLLPLPSMLTESERVPIYPT